MSIKPGGGRYIPDPYAGINFALTALMVLGTLLLVWHAFGVAGSLPPPPLIFPPAEVMQQRHLQVMVYALALVSVAEFVALPLVLRCARQPAGANATRAAYVRMVIRLSYTAAIYIYIAVLWAITRHNPSSNF